MILNELNILEEEIKEHNKKTLKREEEIFKKAKELLFSMPEIAGVVWTQYTPNFNDGDPCVFSVNEGSLLVTKEFLNSLDKKLRDDLQTNSYHDINQDGYQSIRPHWDEKISSSYPKNLKDIFKIFSAFERVITSSAMEMYFSSMDEGKAILTREGLKIEYYEHD